MKRISIILSIFLALLFALNLRNATGLFRAQQPIQSIIEDTLAGFDTHGQQHKALNDLETRISTLVIKQKTIANNLKKFEIGLNLVITVITGLSTLLATISTIRHNSISKSTAILIAAITFVASLLSYSISQVNVFKEEATVKLENVIQLRRQLESLKPEELDRQIPLINRRLNEAF